MELLATWEAWEREAQEEPDAPDRWHNWPKISPWIWGSPGSLRCGEGDSLPWTIIHRVAKDLHTEDRGWARALAKKMLNMLRPQPWVWKGLGSAGLCLSFLILN